MEDTEIEGSGRRGIVSNVHRAPMGFNYGHGHPPGWGYRPPMHFYNPWQTGVHYVADKASLAVAVLITICILLAVVVTHFKQNLSNYTPRDPYRNPNACRRDQNGILRCW